MKTTTSTSLALALAFSMTGCFTTWAGIRAAGYPGATLEGGREERVPLPGVTEKLVISLAPDRVTPSAVHFECKADQHARDAIYRSGFRYGKKWRTTYTIMFALEAALGTALLLTTKPEDPERLSKLAGGWFFAVDAVGTGALALLAPRKEIFTRDEVPVTTPVRSVCPDGVMVEIGSETYPLDAAGSLGELGTAALDEWMQTPTGALVVTFAGRTAMLDVRDLDRCNYAQVRGTPSASTTAGTNAAPPSAPAPPALGPAIPPPPGTAPVVSPMASGPASGPAAGVGMPRTNACGTMPRIIAAVIEIPAGTLAMR